MTTYGKVFAFSGKGKKKTKTEYNVWGAFEKATTSFLRYITFVISVVLITLNIS